MSLDRIQARLDHFRETGARLRVVSDLKVHYGTMFNQLAADYAKGTTRIKNGLRGELRSIWYAYRALMRVEVDLRALYEAARFDLERTLAQLGQSMGERLPEQYENPEPGKPLL